jgi:hypothetical protein
VERQKSAAEVALEKTKKRDADIAKLAAQGFYI